MSKLVNISVNLSKIPQNKKIKGKNSGDEWVSLDVTIKDEPDQWGKDCSISIAQTKDERSNKTPKVFCGNGKKLFGFGESSCKSAQASERFKKDDASDSIPF